MTKRMQARLLVAILAVLATPFAVWGAPGADFMPRNPLDGQELFTEKQCVQCHSIQGVGGKTGPDLGEVWLGSFMDIASKLWNHFPRMNEAFREARLPRPTLTAVETQQLITFLYYLNFFDRRANAEVGEKLFREKSCILCHSVGGKGGHVGPALDPFQGRYAAPFITAALWDKGPKMMRTMAARHVPRPNFEERDVMDILAFIREKGLYDRATRDYVAAADPLQGQELFQQKNCVRCHSIRGQGGTRAPDLATRPLKGRVSYILSHMWNHGAKMWPMMEKEGIPFPQFSADEMSSLMSYLYFLGFQDEPGSPRQGQRVFADNRCAACHLSPVPGAKTIGPDLSRLSLNSPYRIVAEMWNHSPAIEERMRRGQIRWPLLDKDQMRDLIAYVLSLNRAN